jgi:hypothetical protein
LGEFGVEQFNGLLDPVVLTMRLRQFGFEALGELCADGLVV